MELAIVFSFLISMRELTRGTGKLNDIFVHI